MSFFISAQDSRDIRNGKICGVILTVLGVPGALFLLLKVLGAIGGGVKLFSVLMAVLFEPESPMAKVYTDILLYISVSFLIIGLALLCLAVFVESGLLTAAAVGGASTRTSEAAPAIRLGTNRGLVKFILLSLITFNIYALIVMSGISRDINIIASRHDGKKTMNFLLIVFIFSWLTFGIVPLVWSHKISARIGKELQRREIAYGFGAGTFWGWNVLGSLIVVGPFIYMHKLLKSMNLLSRDFNVNG